MRKSLYFSLFVAVPFVALFITLFQSFEIAEYRFLFLLPLSYLVSAFALLKFRLRLGKSVVLTLFFFLQFIRLIVIPLTIIISGYVVFLGNYTVVLSESAILENMSISFLLIFSEHLILTLLLFYLYSNEKLENNNYFVEHEPIISKNLGKLIYFTILFVLTAFFLVCLIRYRSFGKFFSFIWQVQDGDYHFELGSAPTTIYRLFSLTFEFVQILIPSTIVYYLKKRKKSLFNILSFVVVDSICLIVVSNDKMSSIILAGVLLIWYLRDFKKIPVALFSAGIVIVGVALVALLAKNYLSLNNLDGNYGYLSGVLNSYFCGPYNISIGVSMSSQLNAKSFFYDCLTSIPFLPSFVGDVVTSPKLFNGYIKGAGSTTSKIIPMIGQGYGYLSVFAPFFSAVAIRLAVFFEKRSYGREKGLSNVLLIFATIVCCVSPFIYNINILMKSLYKLLVVFFISTFLKGDICYDKSLTCGETRKQSRNRELHY